MNKKLKRRIATIMLFVFSLVGSLGLTYAFAYVVMFGNPNDDTIYSIYETNIFYEDDEYYITSFMDNLSIAEKYRPGFEANPELKCQYISYDDYCSYVNGETNEYEFVDANVDTLISLLSDGFRKVDYSYNNQVHITREYMGPLWDSDFREIYSKIDNNCFVRIGINELVNLLRGDENAQPYITDDGPEEADFTYSFTDVEGKNSIYYSSLENVLWTERDATFIEKYVYIPIDILTDKKVGAELLYNGVYSLERVLYGLNYDYVAYQEALQQLEETYFRYSVLKNNEEIYSNVLNYSVQGEEDSRLSYHINLNSEDGNTVDVFFGKHPLDTKLYEYYIQFAEETGLEDISIILSKDIDYSLYNNSYILEKIFSTKNCVIPTTIISIIMLLIALFLFIYIIAILTKKEDCELTDFEIFTDKIWLEVLIILSGTIIMSVILLIIDGIEEGIVHFICDYGLELVRLVIAVCYTLLFIIINATIFSIIRRIKKKEFFKGLFISWLIRKNSKFYENTLGTIIRSCTKKGKIYNTEVIGKSIFITFLVSCGATYLVPIFLICLDYDYVYVGIVMAIILQVIICFVYWNYISKRLKSLQQIHDGTEMIYNGNLDYKIDNSNMKDFEEHIADFINNIGEGLSNAVEDSVKAARKSIKDERLKAELITNVSHDIKTPLTSIINYVDLLKHENIEGDNALKYIDIIDKKSQRLKMLAEDLVEASRITTGNIELFKENLNLKELINQALAEFEDKYNEKKLIINLRFTDEETVIYADGRRTFRIIDNLLQNVYKYAMGGTRVYVELDKVSNKVTFCVKNISEKPLNIDPKELTERFKRGDESRTTEGSGLGLSIADSLVKLHDGNMTISIDGDLFKVLIEFPESGKRELVEES